MLSDINHFHCFSGHTDIVELLLRSGADTLRKDADGRTAEDRAQDHNHNAVLKVLKKDQKTGGT